MKRVRLVRERLDLPEAVARRAARAHLPWAALRRILAAMPCLCAVLLVCVIAVGPVCGAAQRTDVPAAGGAGGVPQISIQLPNDSGGLNASMKWIALVTVLSLAPALLVMVTCFTRIIVVLGLLRQALATQQLPPNQVLFGLALLMTAVVMAPVYKDVHRDAIAPCVDGRLSQADAVTAAEGRVRAFMIHQVEQAGNVDDVYLFLDEKTAQQKDLAWRDVSTLSLIPGYVVSELKVAFTMGFRFFLPFVVIDMLVAAVLVSMGMIMVPPVLISLPFKLLLFVLANGWHRVVGTLMTSFQ